MPSVISYSALSDWQYCPLYYKLVNIDKLFPFKGNIWTCYGSLLHKYLQAVLTDEIEPNEAARKFARTWKKFCGIFKKSLKIQTNKNPLEFAVPAVKAIATIKLQFAREFGKYKVLKIEERLNETYDEWPQNFKGFIDIVLELENGTIIIADFKSCGSTYFFNKYKDKFKDYQLTLYKHFACKKHGYDPEKVETYFITVEKKIKSKKPVAFFKVGSGKKKVKNALGWLDKALAAINNDHWIKNRVACFKYSNSPYKSEKSNICVFYDTEYCPRNKIIP